MHRKKNKDTSHTHESSTTNSLPINQPGEVQLQPQTPPQQPQQLPQTQPIQSPQMQTQPLPQYQQPQQGYIYQGQPVQQGYYPSMPEQQSANGQVINPGAGQVSVNPQTVPSSQVPANPQAPVTTQQNTAQAPGMKVEKAKSSSCCCSVLITCLVVTVVGLSIMGFFGYSAYKGIKDGAKDLGVEYTPREVESFKKKLNINLGADIDAFCFTCPVKYEGQKKTSFKMTEQEVSAWLQYINSQSGYIKNTQIRFNDGKITVSTNLTYEQSPTLPVLATGTIKRTGEKSVAIDISELKIGIVPVPQSALPDIQQGVNEFVNLKLSEIDGLVINKLEFKDGYMDFDGFIPEKAEGYSPVEDMPIAY